MPMAHVAAVILAAGSSSRLGQPKQLITKDGEPLLRRSIRLAHEAGVSPIFVVLGAHREIIQARTDFTGAQIVVNEEWEEGIASSIRTGVAAVEDHGPECCGVLLMTCDQPELSAEHLRLMANLFQQADDAGVASVYGGTRGIPAIFPRQAFADLMNLRGDRGARGLLLEAPWKVVEIRLEGGEIDLDRPEDLARLK